ncbi:MAG: alpha-D-glucose phosphate-specific phosphoglucomutase, partial [Pseudomonadota bacterium]
EADIAAASDGDGDRNMIVGADIYVTPSDSLAIICEHAAEIPAYAQGLDGVARSMPTSGAVDRVAAELGIECFVTPTGWKFFGNLMDAGRITICGEESFGTGSTHVREKDGLWAYLCWLNIMAATGKSARELVDDHWKRFGRTFYSRHDYEEVPQELADMVVAAATAAVEAGSDDLAKAEIFAYDDPIDGSHSANQGFRFEFPNGSKAIMRLSGTGTVGATIRLYFEKHEADEARFGDDAQDALAEVIAKTETLLGVQAKTGKTGPDVIT